MFKFFIIFIIFLITSNLQAGTIKFGKYSKVAIGAEYNKLIPQTEKYDFLNSSNGIGIGLSYTLFNIRELDSYIKVQYNLYSDINKDEFFIEEDEMLEITEIKFLLGYDHSFLRRSSIKPFVNIELGYSSFLVDTGDNNGFNFNDENEYELLQMGLGFNFSIGAGVKFYYKDSFIIRPIVNYNLSVPDIDYRTLSLNIGLSYIFQNGLKKK